MPLWSIRTSIPDGVGGRCPHGRAEPPYRIERSEQKHPPHTMTILDRGVPIDPAALRTWRTYGLRTRALVVEPVGAVAVERASENLHLMSTGGWMGDLRVRTDDGWRTLRIHEPKLAPDMWERLLDDLASAVAALPLAELAEGAGHELTTGRSTPFIRRLVLRAHALRIEQAWVGSSTRARRSSSVASRWSLVTGKLERVATRSSGFVPRSRNWVGMLRSKHSRPPPSLGWPRPTTSWIGELAPGRSARHAPAWVATGGGRAGRSSGRVLT
jgi:hypothetical protein